MAARYRPRNDIEVEGRKLCGTGGFFDGDTLFYQGTLLIESDMEDMVAALKVPQAKLAKRQLDSASQRVVTLRELLGDDLPPLEDIVAAMTQGFAEGLGIDPRPGVREGKPFAYYETTGGGMGGGPAGPGEDAIHTDCSL